MREEKNIPCVKHFVKGNCPHGARCRFGHNKPPCPGCHMVGKSGHATHSEDECKYKIAMAEKARKKQLIGTQLYDQITNIMTEDNNFVYDTAVNFPCPTINVDSHATATQAMREDFPSPQKLASKIVGMLLASDMNIPELTTLVVNESELIERASETIDMLYEVRRSPIPV
jgi:hypothetical protein